MENNQTNELFTQMQNLSKFPDSKILKSKGTEDIFDSVLKSLMGAVTGKIKDAATGWIMDLIGMGSSGPDQLAEIKKQLEQQAAELKKIQDKIENLNSTMLKAFSEILDVVEKGQYDSAVRILNPSISKITSRYDRLVLLTKNPNPDPSRKSTTMQLAADIIREVPDAFDAIHATLVGTAAGEENLLDFWARLSFKNTNSIDAHEQKINAQFMYFYGLQVKALLLIIEAHHTDPKDIDMATHYFNLWIGRMNEEILVYLRNAPRTTIKNMQSINGTPVNIVLDKDTLHYTTGRMEDPELITLRKSDYAALNKQVPEHSNGAFHMIKKGNFAYMASIDANGTTFDWNFLKIKLGTTPEVVKRLFCPSPGEGNYRFVFPSSMTCNDTTMYVSFVGYGIEGTVIRAIDLDTFSFAEAKDIVIRKRMAYFGDYGCSGGVVHNDKFYATALVSEGSKNELETIDLTKKEIINSTDVNVGYKGVKGGHKRPMAIQGNYLYCAADDTWLRVIDINDPLNPKIVGKVDTGFHIAEIHVEGPLVYFTSFIGSSLDADDRGNINVAFFTSRSGGILSKSAKIGDGIHALAIDKHVIYAGSGKDQNKLYTLSYANDMSKNIISVPPTLSTAAKHNNEAAVAEKA